MRIFHIATAADWAAARRTGAYTTSTRGRSLEQEGFLHASRREQVAGVFARYYADAGEPLVLLTVDTDRLTSPWREEPVGDDTYPHIHGPLNADAVVAVEPLNAQGGTASMSRLMAREIALRLLLLLGAMLLSALGVVLGRGVGGTWGPFLGGLVGLAVGLFLVGAVLRRRL